MHRTQVYNWSDFYQRGIEADHTQYHAIRVLRDPYARAVSIYRHALATKFAEPDLEKFSGGRLSPVTGFSIHQFLDLVESLDFATCNPHYRPQFHFYETVRRPDRVINISKENMFASLNAYAAANGMPVVDISAMDWLHSMEGGRKAKSRTIRGRALDHTAFMRAAANGDRAFPSYEQLLTPSVRERIRKIYAIDFEAYGEFI
jgi:hypothetical protein